jgi:hypothetical protein
MTGTGDTHVSGQTGTSIGMTRSGKERNWNDRNMNWHISF